MIRNRLSILLAERELTATEVSKETGISRTTLSSLVNNSGEGIQFKTLETICRFLDIEPSLFFDYSNALIHYENVKLSSYKYNNTDYEEFYFDLPISVGVEEQVHRFNIYIQSKNQDFSDMKSRFKEFDFYVDIDTSTDFFDYIYNGLSLALKKETAKKILKISIELSKEIINKKYKTEKEQTVSVDIENLDKIEYSL